MASCSLSVSTSGSSGTSPPGLDILAEPAAGPSLDTTITHEPRGASGRTHLSNVLAKHGADGGGPLYSPGRVEGEVRAVDELEVRLRTAHVAALHHDGNGGSGGAGFRLQTNDELDLQRGPSSLMSRAGVTPLGTYRPIPMKASWSGPV